MATRYNRKKMSRYPDKFNQRENKAATSNYQLVTLSTESFTLETEDGVDAIRCSGACTIVLPPSGENQGRRLTVYQVDTAQMTLTPNGSDAVSTEGTAVDLDAAGDWAELQCGGSTWFVIKRFQA